MPDQQPDQQPTRRAARLSRLLPAGTFVVGALLGGLVVGVGLDGGDDHGSNSPTTPTSAPSPSNLTVQVPAAACQDAADAVRQAVRLLQQAAESVRDLQPDQLIDVLNELETLEPRIRELSRQCAAVDVGR